MKRSISFYSGPHFVRTLHMIHPSWVALNSMAYSFTELDKAVTHVISLVSLHANVKLNVTGKF